MTIIIVVTRRARLRRVFETPRLMARGASNIGVLADKGKARKSVIETYG